MASYDTHIQLKVLIYFIGQFFGYDYFAENYHPIMFLPLSLICKYPQEYHVTIISETYMRCD